MGVSISVAKPDSFVDKPRFSFYDFLLRFQLLCGVVGYFPIPWPIFILPFPRSVRESI
jgi:hypothetical protein